MLLRYVARRMLAAIPVVIGVTLITFLLMHATVGSYVPGLDLRPNLKAQDVVALKAALGLDRPLYVQYLDWIGIALVLQKIGLAFVLGGGQNVTPGILEGNFGRSMIDGTSVTAQILERLPNTIELTVTAILIAIVISVPLGTIGALRRGSNLDHFFTVISVGGW